MSETIARGWAYVRRWGHCVKCRRFLELRSARRCDACIEVTMDEEAFEMICDKAAVPRQST